MSKKYEEYISDIKIEYDEKINKCIYDNCFYVKNNKLEQIENDIADIANIIDEEELEKYDQDEEEVEVCDCGNEIVFTYNPYNIIKKYF